MKKESGDMSFPIWLLINPKYPNDVSNIWNPIMYEIQEKVFRKLRARINSRNIYAKSVVNDIGRINSMKATTNIEMFRKSILEYQPQLLFTFDAITNEFVIRALDHRVQDDKKCWNTRNLEDEFKKSIANFDTTQINLIPLIRHTTKISRTINEWEEHSNSYIVDVAKDIAERIIENKDTLNIWI